MSSVRSSADEAFKQSGGPPALRDSKMKPILKDVVEGIQLLSTHNFYLAEDARRPEGPNIGLDGEHLTISFLSLNRAHLAERLCKSIASEMPQFKGEVLAVDNGSNADELNSLRGMLATMPFRWRVVALDRNFGVAGGRNRTIPHVTTPWLMCIDDDIYFISNPLKRIQSDLAGLGCKFLNLPFLGPDRKLLSNGAILHVVRENDETSVLCESAYECGRTHDADGPGFLSSMLCGGASVFEVQTFSTVGRYDENIFVGFEDIDLSIRLFRGGYKVGVGGAVCLVHDHEKPTSEPAKEYERTRYSPALLNESARYLENKYGYKFWWKGALEWLNERAKI